MMNVQLTPKDWQTLSEYLDGQLSEKDTHRVETRLQSQPDLRAGLEELRRNRNMLRSLPKRRAPRNFTLSPSLAQQIRPVRKAQPRFGIAMRYVSAFASFLLVLTLFGDIALKAAQQNLMMTQAYEMQPMVEMAAPEAASGDEATGPAARSMAPSEPAEESELLQALPAEKMLSPTVDSYATETGGMGGGIAPTEMVPEKPTEVASSEESETEQAEAAELGAMDAEDSPQATPTETPLVMDTQAYPAPAESDTQLPTEAPQALSMAVPTEDESLVLTPTPEDLYILPPNEVVGNPAPQDAQRNRVDYSQVLRPAEYILAVIAILSAALAFLIFWKNRI